MGSLDGGIWLGPAWSESSKSSAVGSSQVRRAMEDERMNVTETGVISRTCRVSLFHGLILRQPAGGDGGRLIPPRFIDSHEKRMGTKAGSVSTKGAKHRGPQRQESMRGASAGLNVNVRSHSCLHQQQSYARLNAPRSRHCTRNTRAASTKAAPSKSYASTLLLPKTKFKLWPDYAARDKAFSKRTNEDLYKWQVSRIVQH